MKIALFYHTLVSDWNHGNAHFLRGIASELLGRGHEVVIFEPRQSWSRLSLISEHGQKPIRKFKEAYPGLESIPYDPASLDLGEALAGTNLVLVHEWNDHSLVRRIGEYRASHPHFKLLFHDTHHRMVTDRASMDAYDLSHYDGVLAYGAILKKLYDESTRVRRAWTWHEAADTRVFKSVPGQEPEGDLVWIGNWGDDERTAELHEFLIEPARALKLRARVYGVRYPHEAQEALADAGIQYAGWLSNFEVPAIFGRFRFTVHVPRRPYVRALPGIPTIRPFEALACAIPLICSPWDDAEHLFTPGRDFLVARDRAEMQKHMRSILESKTLAAELAARGLETIRQRHTCRHRVDELLNIYDELKRS